jgi:hypothetical protein
VKLEIDPSDHGCKSRIHWFGATKLIATTETLWGEVGLAERRIFGLCFMQARPTRGRSQWLTLADALLANSKLSLYRAAKK